LTFAGVVLAFSGLGLFRLEKTTTIPFETATTLVMRGPYRFTRNPMYVGLLLAYVGVAGVNAQLWPILVLPLLVSYLQRTVIPLEEGRLTATFGDKYLSYCASVRRWL
jgi:protein-S-isoprenylcysteine O-methyltransferase Ste14